ncbi:uncharacterized protein B4U80_12410, partial [Leptotrombidium deliense]
LDIIQNFHIAYNPQAAGNVERFNGLLKNTLKTLDLPIDKAIPVALTELNNRPRLYRDTPIREYINNTIIIPKQEEASEIENPPSPQKVLIKNRDSTIKPGEIITRAGGNSFWTTDGKGTLRITKHSDLLKRT